MYSKWIEEYEKDNPAVHLTYVSNGSGAGIHDVMLGTVDFAGTSGVHPGNLNAPPAVVRSAILYVLRLLIAEPLPLNEGILRAVDIRIPPGMLNPPFPDDPAEAPAVVGGNVETSQRVVDTLVKALGLLACGQGTMNNLLFGNPRFGFYETVCGGSGAGPGFHGTSGVHVHMTNTRITDPEVLCRCIPGCESLEKTGEDTYAASIKAGIGARNRRRAQEGNGPISPTVSFNCQANGTIRKASGRCVSSRTGVPTRSGPRRPVKRASVSERRAGSRNAVSNRLNC